MLITVLVPNLKHRSRFGGGRGGGHSGDDVGGVTQGGAETGNAKTPQNFSSFINHICYKT